MSSADLERTTRSTAGVPRLRSIESTGDAFGDAIKSARLGARLTQAALGKRLGVSQQSVGHWERGDERPSARVWPGIQALFEEQGIDSDDVSELKNKSEAVENTDYRTQLMAAFIVRIESGPPLNESEASIVRDLAQLPVQPLAQPEV